MGVWKWVGKDRKEASLRVTPMRVMYDRHHACYATTIDRGQNVSHSAIQANLQALEYSTGKNERRGVGALTVSFGAANSPCGIPKDVKGRM